MPQSVMLVKSLGFDLESEGELYMCSSGSMVPSQMNGVFDA